MSSTTLKRYGILSLVRDSDHFGDYETIFLVMPTESKIKPRFILGRVTAIHSEAWAKLLEFLVRTSNFTCPATIM